MKNTESTNSADSEVQRILKLIEQVNPDLDQYLRDGYQAVALHASSTIIAVNPAAAELFGYTAEEMIGMNAWPLFAPKSFDALLHHLSTKSTDAYCVEGLRKDGSNFKVELKGKDFSIARENIRAVLLREVD